MLTSFESTQERSMASKLALSRTRSTRFRAFLVCQTTRFIDAWYSVQLAHYGGKYSIERMLALEEYVRRTSLNRVLLVTLGVPLLAVGLVLCQESVPLQDPGDGWETNYGFWFRAGLVGVGVGNAAAIQIAFWLDVPPLSLKKMLPYCTLMAAGYVAAGMVIAKYWVFPVPFFMFTLCPVTWLVIVLYVRLVVGPNAFQQILSHQAQVHRLKRVGTVQSLMFVVYPVYQVLFTKASQTNYELPVLLLLPAIRLALKLMFASAAANKEDMIPAQVVFTVDFFDSFYFATFIQSVSSWTLATVMTVDLIQTAAEMYELHQRTQRIFNQLHRIGIVATNSYSLLVAVRALCSTPQANSVQLENRIQVRSCIYHYLSEESRLLLRRFESYSSAGSSISSFQQNFRTLSTASFVVPKPASNSGNTWCKCYSQRKATVKPLPLTTSPSPTKRDIPRANTPHKSRKQSVTNTLVILEEALEVLFTSECLVLSEYMEVIVPSIYGIFVLAVTNFPWAQYHADLIGVTQDKFAEVVARVFVYALMELGSFVVLALIKKRSCGISALYQLSFVLETQTLFVQSTLMMWILMTLTYRVVHFGTLNYFLRSLRYKTNVHIPSSHSKTLIVARCLLDQAVTFLFSSSGLDTICDVTSEY